MLDTNIPLNIPPGVFRNGTRYESKGRWYDANLVRFFEGTKQPMGGWRYIADDAGGELGSLTGLPRAVTSWRADVGDSYIAFGTTQKIQLYINGILYDVTPAGFTLGRADTGTGTGDGGYGAGAYSLGTYGIGSTAVRTLEADTWQLDQFGDWLVGVCTSDGKLYVWQGDVAVPAAAAAGAPVNNRGVVVTPERFVVVLGAGGNLRKVQWPSQETTTVWTPLPTNSAGDFELATNGRLRCGRRTTGQTLLWTDTDMWAMTYIGAPFYYSFSRKGTNGIVAPNAVAMADERAFWMGTDGFYVYDGYTKPIPCEVADYVFNDFSDTQRVKISAMSMEQFGEIWWYYPSASATENDRYVIYNYRENHWTIGRLPRACGAPAGATQYPIMCDRNGRIYEHEILSGRVGLNELGPFLADGSHDATGDLEALGILGYADEIPYLESGPIELNDGDNVVGLNRLIPDSSNSGDVVATFYGAFDPTGEETIYGPYAMLQPTDVRITARQLRIRLSEATQTSWRVGKLRFSGVVKGQR